MTEETHPEAATILREAGWAPHDAWNVYTRDTLVMGFQPDGQGFHVKNWAKVQPGDRAYSDDTPDTAEEAAAWLVARFNVNPLSTEATLEPLAAEIELAEDSAHESNGETGEAFVLEAPSDDGAGGAADAEGLLGAELSGFSGEGEGGGESELRPDFDNGSADIRGDVSFDPIDADFTVEDLGAELLDDEAFAVPELEAPPPEDFAPDEIEPEPEHAAGAFIFGDNLAHDRIIRIGQLSEHANTLIDAAKVGYSDAEHIFVHSHVVTNMNEAGAYVGGRQDLFDRFIELEAVTSRIRRIEMHRDERQDFIRSADREAVAAFDPSQGWP